MFPQQRQQQHFQQQLLQLQQLIHQQRQQHRHPHPHQGGSNRAMQQHQHQHYHPQQQQHQLPQQQQQQQLNLRPTSQPSLLNPNPMLQRALIMQQMQGGLHGYSMTAPGLQPFFSPGPRASILGTPPLGIQLQTPRIRFGNQLFQQHHRRFNKDFKRMHDMRRDRYPPREPFRAKMDEQHDANKINEEAAGNKPANAKDAAGFASSKTEDSSQTDEPDAKRRRLESENDDNLIEHSDAGESATSKSKLKGEDRDKETSECEGSGAQNLEHSAANTEMLSTMSTLKVTIQQSSESRAISTSAPDSVTKGSEDSTEEMDSTPAKFICYICNANCYNQKNFQKHMNGTRHHQRLLEIQQMSNACLATMIPKSDGIGRGRESDKKRPRWCSTCQAHFRGNVIEHRRTPRHKLAKYSLRPFCTVCSRHFKTPRKFVEHMKSPEHKQKVEEVKLKRSSQDKDQAGQDDPEDLITVDAVGCFDEDDEEGMTEEEEDDSISDCLSDRDSQALLSEFEKEPYDAEAVYGQEFVVPVTGFLCKLCHKFYHSESTARFTHCKSLMHFQNLQGYKAQRAQDCSSASAQDPAPSGVSSFGSTDDHKSGQKEMNTDTTSPEAAASEPETEEVSANAEIQAPTLLGVDDAVPSVGQDSASPSQNLQLKNSSDGTGEISESAPVTVFASKLIETPTPNNEALGSTSLAVEQVSASEKCEGSSITGSEAADDDQDGNEECDLSLTKAEEPSETEDGEEEPLVEKECEGVTVKEESNDAEAVIDCIPLEFNTPKTRSGRATRGRRFSARRKK
ncbi:cip1-interacting zinc finger protein-like isoform X1 [Hemiscyllium ocellatum]|uniref:cip1-interacting zinc finger protein-like isoform X1 n=1 Tax=Hemiscyllium ocellatum TaxID=170820 RepID=UPI002966E76B|nr:cip1-interacting zinc finger protein-like isoform X1 [Hemiscyllium ocellatum]